MYYQTKIQTQDIISNIDDDFIPNQINGVPGFNVLGDEQTRVFAVGSFVSLLLWLGGVGGEKRI